MIKPLTIQDSLLAANPAGGAASPLTVSDRLAAGVPSPSPEMSLPLGDPRTEHLRAVVAKNVAEAQAATQLRASTAQANAAYTNAKSGGTTTVSDGPGLSMTMYNRPPQISAPAAAPQPPSGPVSDGKGGVRGYLPPMIPGAPLSQAMITPAGTKMPTDPLTRSKLGLDQMKPREVADLEYRMGLTATPAPAGSEPGSTPPAVSRGFNGNQSDKPTIKARLESGIPGKPTPLGPPTPPGFTPPRADGLVPVRTDAKGNVIYGLPPKEPEPKPAPAAKPPAAAKPAPAPKGLTPTQQNEIYAKVEGMAIATEAKDQLYEQYGVPVPKRNEAGSIIGFPVPSMNHGFYENRDTSRVAPGPPATMGGPALGVGSPFLGSKIVRTGKSGNTRVFALEDGRIVDEQGRPAQ